MRATRANSDCPVPLQSMQTSPIAPHLTPSNPRPSAEKLTKPASIRSLLRSLRPLMPPGVDAHQDLQAVPRPLSGLSGRDLLQPRGHAGSPQVIRGAGQRTRLLPAV